jgi:hypothetical protein
MGSGERGEYPAEGSKVTEVLDKLEALEAGEPIAKESANHNALEVGEKAYGRKVTLKSGQEARTLILGQGPGGSVHVRFDGHNEVHRSRGLSVWDIRSGPSGYIDTKFVEVERDKLSGVTVTNEKGRLTFKKEGGVWQLEELPEGKRLDESKVNTFIDEVARLDLEEPVGREPKPEYGLDHGTGVALTCSEGGESRTMRYTIGAKKDDATFFAKSDGNDFVVTVSKWRTDGVREKAAQDFAKEEKAAGEEEKGSDE